MKILVTTQSEKSIGLHNAAISLGHQSYLWSEENKSTFDVFHELEPEVVIIDSWQISRSLKKCIESRISSLKVLVCSELPSLADNVIHKPGQFSNHLKSEFAIIGPQDSSLVLPFCYPVGKYDIRIYGGYKWKDIVQHVGQININTFNDICASSSYMVNFSNNRQLSYNILAAGGIPVHHTKYASDMREFGDFAIILSTLDEIPLFRYSHTIDDMTNFINEYSYRSLLIKVLNEKN